MELLQGVWIWRLRPYKQIKSSMNLYLMALLRGNGNCRRWVYFTPCRGIHRFFSVLGVEPRPSCMRRKHSMNRAYPLEAYILILSLPRFLCSPAIVRGAVLFHQVLHAMMLCLTLGSKVMELAHYGMKSLKYKPSS